MSTLPSRTRSVRKPAIGTGTDTGKGQDAKNTVTSDNDDGGRSRNDAVTGMSDRRGNQSPSRLPVKYSASASAIAPTSSSTSAATANSGLSRTASIKRNGASTTTSATSTSMRPPPRTGISRPPITSDNNKSSIRTGARTPTDQSTSQTSLQRKPSTSKHTRNGSSTTLTSSVRSNPPGHARNSSTSSIANSRPASSHTRNASLLTASTTLHPPSIRPPSQSQVGQPPTNTTSSATGPELRRPAFSTLQQHYSPAKSLAPKPFTASFLAPPTPSKLPSNVALSAETARLQAELLQLHLLHRDSVTVQAQWHASAKEKLEGRFNDIVKRHKALVDLEVSEVDRVNSIALKGWADAGVPGWGLEERIQSLDEVLTGIWNMGESGGKYSRVVRRFERWVDEVQDIIDGREDEEQGAQGDVDEPIPFIAEIEASWKDDCEVLRRKLERWRAVLKDLSTAEEHDVENTKAQSSVAVILNGCRNLTRGMLMELLVMRQIETDVMANERDWIAGMIDEPSDDDDDGLGQVAAWRL